ncbi:hypothetical protein HYALB_00000284 [Hymenoscyphus albidus]|uniref:Bromodomain-containing protein n=1 Tax=Hymenoscyphus albidus TaxID=595503 RepID=A0A9N9LU43_9HELO|nr:hypothetical protein HYALB_00000284 [Hymenoscyphus albidus]
MAVMTTQQPEGVAVEQKIQPVPSSDKMALDLEINGQTPRAETIVDSTSSDLALNKSAEATSPSTDAVNLTSKAVAVNGTANDDAFAANQTIPTPPIDNNPEVAQIDKEASNLPQVPDTNTNTTATEAAPLSTSLEIQQPDPSALLASTDLAVEAAVDDTAAVSTVPPVVETQESDLRNTISSPIPSDSAPLDAAQNLTLGPDSSQDLFQDTNDSSGQPVVAAAGTEAGESTLENPLNEISQDSQVDQTGPQNTEDLNMILDAPIAAKPSADVDMSATTNDSTQPESADTAMVDVLPPSQSSNKRDAVEDEEQPPAKRTKTEETDGPDAGSSFASRLQNGTSPAPATNGQPAKVGEPVTNHMIKECVKILKNAARTAAGKNFKAPVATLWPGLAEAYNAKIANPTDLATMETNLKTQKYSTLQDFKADVNLLYTNACEFNGDTHLVANSARELRDSIFEKLRRIPPEPAPVVKKEKKQPKKPTPVAEAAPRPPPPRRLSKGSGQPAQAQTFALDPATNTPLIRRDSTKNDSGRFPKREIHPPKNKDLPYSAKPKSRKFATELRFCEEVLTELKKAKHSHLNHIFMEAVDPVALNIPTYFDIIKEPRDLGMVTENLRTGHYANAKEFEKDMRLITSNCCRFNPSDNPVHQMGKDFEALFNSLWAKKNQWISEHSPAAHSPSPTVESDDEESDDEEPEGQAPMAGSAAAARLIEEQGKLIALMTGNKKKDQASIDIQQQVVEMLQKRVNAEAETEKKPKKAKAPKPKKAAPAPKKEKPTSKKPTKKPQKYMGTIEKEIISDGLGLLPEDISQTVLDMIKDDQGGIDVGEDGTLELDIDVISMPVLWQIHAMIMEHAPEVEATVRARFAEREGPRTLAKPAPKKKNKPMSKHEQERNIQHLRKELQSFNQPSNRPGSEDTVLMQTVEKPEEESSGDESSDSEEE